jgi:hypothetical protein
MSKFKKCTLCFFKELEKEAKLLEKTNQENALVLKKIIALKQQTIEFALEDILEQLERHPFLNIKPQTMQWANLAIEHSKNWPPERISR